MASSLVFFLISTILILSNSISNAQPSSRPRALVLSITKDASTLQYTTIIRQRTPLATINVVLDLGGQFLWVDCDQFYESSSYVPARCGSAQCSPARYTSCATCYAPPRPGCNNNTCGVSPDNTVTGIATSGELAQDILAMESTNGKNVVSVVSVRRFLFTCGSTILLNGLASGVRGMAGLGRGRIGLPSRLAAAFSFNKKFAICLPSSISASGVVFFGNGPYIMQPNIDISTSLTYTPLLINPVGTSSAYTEEKSTEYFIGVKSIKVNDKAISLNTSLLSIKSNGFGGTKISTVNPYTVLETSIYKALTAAFIKEANLSGVPFTSRPRVGFCFDSSKVGSTRAGPKVPNIDFVLQSENVYWRITGANSLVPIEQAVGSLLCWGFVDGGSNPRTSIVIGAHQLQDNLLQFDLATSRLGFSSSLLSRQTTCSNFNFITSNA